MAMILDNMLGLTTDPIAMDTYSLNHGARDNGGTNMITLANAIIKDYPLAYVTTNDEAQLLMHLKNGGIAIGNVGGNRENYVGVYSSEGHFIVVAGIDASGKIIVLDPGYYPGKFNLSGRTGKVATVGNECICDISVLAKDTENRSPAYWLFKTKGVQEDMKIGIEIPEVKVIMKGKAMDKAVILNVDGKDTTYIPAVALRDISMTVAWDDSIKTVLID
jgi:hypothetical protein